MSAIEQVIRTKVVAEGRPESLGKWNSAAAMVRLVREMAGLLEEAGVITDHTPIDNVLYDFLATLPRKVQDDVLHG
jgi:hypothetical protein